MSPNFARAVKVDVILKFINGLIETYSSENYIGFSFLVGFNYARIIVRKTL